MGFAACKQKTFQTNNKYSYDSSNCCIRHYKPMTNKVLKLGSDRTFRLKKPRTVHFCSSFSLKNRSMGKKQGPVRTAVGPHDSENHDQTASHGSLLPFESKP